MSANDVARVLIARSGRPWTNALTLQKLLYYTQAWHLAVTNEPLFTGSFKAYANGPVLPSVMHTYRDPASRRAASQDEGNVDLDPIADALINLVIATYGDMSPEELSALTHTEEPWLEARGDTPEGERCNRAIALETMARFYRENRKLAGHFASDLAAGGIPHPGPHPHSTFDIAAMLEDEDEDWTMPDDPWGGGNLIASPPPHGKLLPAVRAYAEN